MIVIAAIAVGASACTHGSVRPSTLWAVPFRRDRVRLHGETPRLLVVEGPRLFCKAATVLFALFDTRIAFREGTDCVEDDSVYRVVDLQPEDMRWITENIAYNPLIANAPVQVDYCPKCIGGRAFLLGFRTGRGELATMALLNPCSGNEMSAEFTRSEERYGAQAAEELVCSVDRLVDAMPVRFPEARLKRWPTSEPIHGRQH